MVKTSINKLKRIFFKTDVICRLFHKIEKLETCCFVDKVSGDIVGKFKCNKCNKKYLANTKRGSFRCYV